MNNKNKQKNNNNDKQINGAEIVEVVSGIKGGKIINNKKIQKNKNVSSESFINILINRINDLKNRVELLDSYNIDTTERLLKIERTLFNRLKSLLYVFVFLDALAFGALIYIIGHLFER